MEKGCVEERHSRILLPQQMTDLGTPQDNAAGTRGDELHDHTNIRFARLVADYSEAKLVEDDAMKEFPRLRLRDVYGEPRTLESLPVEILLHGEGSAQKPDVGDPRFTKRPGGWVGDMEQRYPHDDIVAAMTVAVQNGTFDVAGIQYLLHTGRAVSSGPSVTPTAVQVSVEERALETYDWLQGGDA